MNVQDPVIHDRLWWIMETLKHQECTAGWVARLLQLAFHVKSDPNFPLGKYQWDNTVVNLSGGLVTVFVGLTWVLF